MDQAEQKTDHHQRVPPTRMLGVVTKYWLPGTVKTRLAASIGFSAATAIHQHFTQHLITTLAGAADRQAVFVAPDQCCAPMRVLVGRDWEVCPQGDGNLGDRMVRAFRNLLPVESDRLHASAVLVGADLPTLSPADVADAFRLLADHDMVLGPADDGGYYLIGLRGPWREVYEGLFDAIPWSTEEVFSITFHRAAEMGLSCGLLSKREDIDTFDALSRLLLSESLDGELRQAIQMLLPPTIDR